MAPALAGDQTALLKRLAEDVDGAFGDLVVAHQDGLFAFALGLCGNAHDAEEIAQDAFIRAHRALSTYDAARIRDMRLRPWLYRIALNAARNRWRRRGLSPVSLGDTDDPPASPAQGPEAMAERRHDRDAVRAGLQRLSPRLREAVVARHVRGLTYEEAAQVLGIPSGTVKSNVHRGLARLRQDLAALREVV